MLPKQPSPGHPSIPDPPSRACEIVRRDVGRRIRSVRVAAGLRQRELAEQLGTTQSAVHKYERGTLPGPGRLLQLARVGNTTVEWLLTGEHWEDGSIRQQRVPPDVMTTAGLLEQQSESDRRALHAALRLLRAAVRVCAGPGAVPTATPVSRSVHAHGRKTLDLLEAAWHVQCRVLHHIADDAGRRLRNSWFVVETDRTPGKSRDGGPLPNPPSPRAEKQR